MNKGRIEQAGTPDQVYEHPANPFVLNFLGNVNLFHGRIQSDLGAGENSVAYVRSHDIEIDRARQDSTSLQAEIRHIRKLGPSVRVTLVTKENTELIEAELTRDIFQNLGLQHGESVYVRPRQVRIFVEDYQI